METPHLNTLVQALRALPRRKLIALAINGGAKFFRHDKAALLVPQCPWAVLDQEKYPRLYWGYFPTRHAASMVFCFEHEIFPHKDRRP